jgi:hypothetical protein
MFSELQSKSEDARRNMTASTSARDAVQIDLLKQTHCIYSISLSTILLYKPKKSRMKVNVLRGPAANNGAVPARH